MSEVCVCVCVCKFTLESGCKLLVFSFFLLLFLLLHHHLLLPVTLEKQTHFLPPYSPHPPATPGCSAFCMWGGCGSGGFLPRFSAALSAPSGIIRGSFVCDYSFYLQPASYTDNILSATPSSPTSSLLHPPSALSAFLHCSKTQKAKK